MEAPFPALGKTIAVKTFLPGSGTEVSQGVVQPGTPLWLEGLYLPSGHPVQGCAPSISPRHRTLSPVCPAQAPLQGATPKGHAVHVIFLETCTVHPWLLFAAHNLSSILLFTFWVCITV